MDDDDIKPKMLIFLLSYLILWLLWFIFIFVARIKFQNTLLSDDLAMVESVLPYFYALMAGFALLCIYNIRTLSKKQTPNILLIIQLFAFLLYTPHLMSQFAYEPPGVYHVGVAANFSEVMDGVSFIFPNYARTYPLSFALNGGFLEILGTNISAYSNIIYPAIIIIPMAILWYASIAKMFNPKIAFISSILALYGLHFFKLYPSPQTLGTVLVFSMIFALVLRSRTGFILAIFFILCASVTHPISAAIAVLIFVCFLLPSILPNISKKTTLTKKHIKYFIMAAAILILISVSPFVTTLKNSLINKMGSMDLSKVLDLVLSPGFYYSEIYYLNQGIYFVYLAILIGVSIFAFKHLKNDLINNKKMEPIFVFNIMAILIIPAGILLYLMSGLHDLIERTMSYFILFSSVFIIGYLIQYWDKEMVRLKRLLPLSKSLFKNRGIVFVTFLVFLAITFPVVSYSIGVYNSTPVSEKTGLEYLSNHYLADDTNVSLSLASQLAMFAEPPLETSLYATLPVDNSTEYDAVCYRMTSYYYYSLRIDLSFESNRWLDSHEMISNLTGYQKTYTSSTFEIYWRTSDG